jgi:hypothetical protein
MLRAIVGVILGYLIMAVLVFATFSMAYLAMGADGAFQPGSYEVTTLWLVTSFVLGLLAAVVGGAVCAFLGRGGKAPVVLAALVVALGLLMALPAVMAADSGQPKVREGNVPNLEAMQSARQPAWVALVNPFLGAAGVLLGARLRTEAPGSARR